VQPRSRDAARFAQPTQSRQGTTLPRRTTAPNPSQHQHPPNPAQPNTQPNTRPTPNRGVVWYNHLKLRDLKDRVSTQQRTGSPTPGAPGGQKGDPAAAAGYDEERNGLVSVVTHRTKGEILSEIRRLQEEMEALEGSKAAGAGGGGSDGGGRYPGAGLIGTRVGSSGDGAAMAVVTTTTTVVTNELKSRGPASPGPGVGRLARLAAGVGPPGAKGMSPSAEKEV